MLLLLQYHHYNSDEKLNPRDKPKDFTLMMLIIIFGKKPKGVYWGKKTVRASYFSKSSAFLILKNEWDQGILRTPILFLFRAYMKSYDSILIQKKVKLQSLRFCLKATSDFFLFAVTSEIE